jgi:hypothetical protein
MIDVWNRRCPEKAVRSIKVSYVENSKFGEYLLQINSTDYKLTVNRPENQDAH